MHIPTCRQNTYMHKIKIKTHISLCRSQRLSITTPGTFLNSFCYSKRDLIYLSVCVSSSRKCSLFLSKTFCQGPCYSISTERVGPCPHRGSETAGLCLHRALPSWEPFLQGAVFSFRSLFFRGLCSYRAQSFRGPCPRRDCVLQVLMGITFSEVSFIQT